MEGRPIRIRRGRRTDFAAVLAVLAGPDTLVPPPDRRTLHRFRQLVADLGCDFYLATIDERVVGVVHVTYARQLAAAPLATLATLAVAESSRGRGVGTALLRFVTARARKRGCGNLRCALAEEPAPAAAALLQRAGARPRGTVLELALTGQ
jgi:GNAT superfamily N-acetyltransferase